MAENVYELNININGGSRRKSTSGTSSDAASTSSTESGGVLSSVRRGYKDTKALLNATGVAMVASSVINYTTSRVGITTGNYQKQQEINAVKTVAGQLAAVGSGFLMGGVGGGLLALGAIGLSYWQQYDTYNFNRRAEAAQLSIRREREGLLSASRSRSSVQ